MKEIDVNNHATVTTVIDNNGKIRLGIYDNTYGVEQFRGCYAPIGGNGRKDAGPVYTLTRELAEELLFVPAEHETLGSIVGADYGESRHEMKGHYMEQGMRQGLHDEILSSMQPCADFLLHVEKGPVKPVDLTILLAVYLAYVADLSAAEKGLADGLLLRNERLSSVVTPDQLVQMKGAWGYKTIMHRMLGLPLEGDFDFIRVEWIGTPRETFADYKRDFAYARDPES